MDGKHTYLCHIDQDVWLKMVAVRDQTQESVALQMRRYLRAGAFSGSNFLPFPGTFVASGYISASGDVVITGVIAGGLQ